MANVRSTTHYSDPLERYAESAWRNLKLDAPADLLAVCGKLKIVVSKKLMEADLNGFLIITPKRLPVIVVNDGLPISRQRFTMAHEIGHHLIEPKHRPGMVCKMLSGGPWRTTPNERRADMFAAALLMPHWLVRQWFGELRYNASGRIAVMADRLQVSHTAMRIRLEELGLEKRAYRPGGRDGIEAA